MEGKPDLRAAKNRPKSILLRVTQQKHFYSFILISSHFAYLKHANEKKINCFNVKEQDSVTHNNAFGPIQQCLFINASI